jgi:DivIVA domain-containing protein
VVRLLLFLLVLIVVGGVAAVAAGLITGGLDDPASTVPARELPDRPLSRSDVDELHFSPALRGYRMEQVDAAMDRLGAEVQRLQDEVDGLRAEAVRLREQLGHQFQEER